MSGNTLKFNNIRVNKKEFQKSKQVIGRIVDRIVKWIDKCRSNSSIGQI